MKTCKDTQFVVVSTLCIFLACSLVILGYFAWNPIRAQWYIWKLRRNVGDGAAAIEKLRKMKSSGAVVWALVEALDGRYGQEEAYRAHDALCDLDRQMVSSVLTEVLKNGHDDKSRSECTRELAMLQRETSVPILIEMLDDKSNEVRGGAAWGLGFLKEKSVAPKLIEMLREDSATVRASAAWSLGQIGDKSSAPSVIEILASFLKEEDVGVRGASAYALMRLLWICPEKSVLTALKEVVNDPEYTVRCNSILAIGSVGGESETPLLKHALLTDEHPSVRAAAAWSLGRIGGYATVPLLTKVLSDDDHERVRRSSAFPLGKIGDRSAIPSLIRGLSDSNRSVREGCHEALEAITGEEFDYGDDAVQKWREKLGMKGAVKDVE